MLTLSLFLESAAKVAAASVMNGQFPFAMFCIRDKHTVGIWKTIKTNQILVCLTSCVWGYVIMGYLSQHCRINCYNCNAILSVCVCPRCFTNQRISQLLCKVCERRNLPLHPHPSPSYKTNGSQRLIGTHTHTILLHPSPNSGHTLPLYTISTYIITHRLFLQKEM